MSSVRPDVIFEHLRSGERALARGAWDDARASFGAALREGEPEHLRLYEAVLDRMAVGTATHPLDAGCGSGLALQLALRRGAQVTGLDASAAPVEIARKRVGEVHVQYGELEDLPYPEGAFTAVTSFNAVQYAGNPKRALVEMRRVAQPGALVSVATWGQPQDCEMRVVFEALRPLLPPPPPGNAGGGPFGLSAPGALEGLLGEAGLTVDHREGRRMRLRVRRRGNGLARLGFLRPVCRCHAALGRRHRPSRRS